MRALDKIRNAMEFLQRSGVEDSQREAEDIITHCLGIGRPALFRDNPVISDEEIVKIDKLLKRRSQREPLQYIFGCVDFYGLKIRVGKGVLIPRPETELLVEVAIKTLYSSQLTPTRVLDLCTGSGCVALAIAKEFPDVQVYATDTSKIALGYAVENARINRIRNAKFLIGNLFEPIARRLTVNLIVSNPPYIRRDELKSLQPEIRDWEPIDALDGGEDGLDYYREIIPGAKRHLKKGGFLVLELGFNQSEMVRKIAEDAGFIDISLVRDYAGIERILVAKAC